MEREIGITNINEYDIPEGLPVDPEKWATAIETHRGERQLILNALLQQNISGEVANVELGVIRERVITTYQELLG